MKGGAKLPGVRLPPMEVVVDEDGSEVLVVVKDRETTVDCDNGVIFYGDTAIQLGVKCTYKESKGAIYIYPV